MLLFPVLLCTVITLAVGYDDGNYGTYGGGYYDYEDHKSECRKLKHYDIEPSNIADHNKEAKFSHVEKHGKNYIMISCPVDSQKYALIAENEGSTAEISGTKYSDSVVLADGIQIGVLAKCRENRITAETTSGDKVRIKKVACIQYLGSITSDTPTCSPCSLCNIEPLIISSLMLDLPIKVEETKGPDQCKQVEITCGKEATGRCNAVQIGFVGNKNSNIVLTDPTTENSVSVVVRCQNDMTFSYDAKNINPVNTIGCIYSDCIS